MATTFQGKSSKTRKPRRPFAPHKPNGVLSPRVQAVGPEHFGIVSVDCAKLRSKLTVCDFYGKVLLAPTEFDHTRGGLALVVARVQEVIERACLKDAIVSIERTGNYHLPRQTSLYRGRLRVPHRASFRYQDLSRTG